MTFFSNAKLSSIVIYDLLGQYILNKLSRSKEKIISFMVNPIPTYFGNCLKNYYSTKYLEYNNLVRSLNIDGL